MQKVGKTLNTAGKAVDICVTPQNWRFLEVESKYCPGMFIWSCYPLKQEQDVSIDVSIKFYQTSAVYMPDVYRELRFQWHWWMGYWQKCHCSRLSTAFNDFPFWKVLSGTKKMSLQSIVSVTGVTLTEVLCIKVVNWLIPLGQCAASRTRWRPGSRPRCSWGRGCGPPGDGGARISDEPWQSDGGNQTLYHGRMRWTMSVFRESHLLIMFYRMTSQVDY